MAAESVKFEVGLIGFAADSEEFRPQTESKIRHPMQVAEPSQPAKTSFDPRLVAVAEEIYKARRKRDAQFQKFFGDGLFCEPAWDILLDLYINNGQAKTISVSSACLASAVPVTTALRYISELVRRQLVERSPHPDDRRAFFLHLSSLAVSIMEGWLTQHATVQKNH
jgi:DNA-binding MarR family transcriptional regulator